MLSSASWEDTPETNIEGSALGLLLLAPKVAGFARATKHYKEEIGLSDSPFFRDFVQCPFTGTRPALASVLATVSYSKREHVHVHA